MRILKEPVERKNEIVESASKLFQSKGYENTTVNDILKDVGISKGAFYYYFASKEEVLNEIVVRIVERAVSGAREAIKDETLNPTDKLVAAFLGMRVNDTIDNGILDELHKANNALLHQKTLNLMVSNMAPLLVKIIEDGIDKKVWSCKYPQEYMQIFLASALTLTDDGIFELDQESQMKAMVALISVLEKMLEVPENSFMEKYIEKFS